MPPIGDRGEMEAFVRSVELGSFSAAARELRLTPSALSKLVTRFRHASKKAMLTGRVGYDFRNLGANMVTATSVSGAG